VRIQDFFRQVELDYEQVALLMCLLLPRQGKVRLCIDRTEWDFGKCQVNILMVLASQGAVQVPLYWELLDRQQEWQLFYPGPESYPGEVYCFAGQRTHRYSDS